MLRKIAFASVLLLSACATKIEVIHTAEFLCGSQLLTVSYLTDDSVLLSLNSERIYLKGCSNDCDRAYKDITGNTNFWQKGNSAWLKIGTTTYPTCQNLF